MFAVNRSSVKMRHCSVVASVNSGFTAIAVESVLNAIKLLGRATSYLGVSAVVQSKMELRLRCLRTPLQR